MLYQCRNGATRLKNWNVCFICCWRHWCKNTIEPSKWSNSSRLQKMYLEKDSNWIQVENEIQTVTPAIRISSHKKQKKSPIVVLRTSLFETKSIMNTCISSKLGMVRDIFNREFEWALPENAPCCCFEWYNIEPEMPASAIENCIFLRVDQKIEIGWYGLRTISGNWIWHAKKFLEFFELHPKPFNWNSHDSWAMNNGNRKKGSKYHDAWLPGARLSFVELTAVKCRSSDSL